MSDTNREMLADPHAHFREMDTHLAMRRIAIDALGELRVGNYSEIPPWFCDTDGKPLPNTVRRLMEDLGREIAYYDAEIAAGRDTPLKSHLHRLEDPEVVASKNHRRTQVQVDGLWPTGRAAYTIEGMLSAPVATIEEMSLLLQKLFEGHQAAAGMYKINSGKPSSKRGGIHDFNVTFIRDVHDDFDVVNPRLLDGENFHSVLTDQLAAEIKNAIADTKSPIELVSLAWPYFSD